jgi:hypothetical protein
MAIHSPFPSTVLSARCGPRYAPPWPVPRKIERTKELQRQDKRKAQSRGDFLLLFPFIPSPEFLLRRLAWGVFLSWLRGHPSHIRGGEEVQDRLAASLVGEEIPDLEPVLTSPCLPPYLCPQGFLLAFPVRAACT